MDKVKIARVAVSAVPYLIDKPYAYLIPAALEETVQAGMRTLVPFGRGNRIAEGVILAVEQGEKKRGMKELMSVLDAAPVLNQSGIRLALWMRERYFCTMYDAVRTILPAGLWFHTQIVYTVFPGVDKAEAYQRAAPVAGAWAVLDLLYANGGKGEEELLRTNCGARSGTVLKALCDQGILRREAEAMRQVKDGKRKIVSLAVPAEDAMAAVAGKQRSAPLRYEAVKLLCAVGSASQAELCYFTGASSATIRSLKKAGLVEVHEEEKLRVEPSREIAPGGEIILNDEQQTVYEQLVSLSRKAETATVLVHGVTGSGKTQVYLRLAMEMISQGRTGIVLVPEIALTPQMMDQFATYFGDRVVMLHSGLRMTELYDQWKRIRRGEVQLVLGTRSAIFAPLTDLGFIILDEEQETSYRSETPPRYHALEIAQYLCAENKALLVLGSATPSITTAYAAKEGVYHLAELHRRYNQQALPQVLFADLKEEVRAGNNGTVSSLLRRELEKNIEKGEQSILLINRRGSSRMLLCGECGHVPECPRCSVPLTYHSANGRLMCHYCGHSQTAEEYCPACGGRMKHVGTGTQKAEEELRALFPDTELLRMDADTVSIRGGHEKILREFSSRSVPILLGTQMVAKGLDFENVTLVGVLLADLSLYVDHYCAAERTFSLLTQVIGRAGRGAKGGRAVIQTFTPENEVLRCAARQDYEQFYRSEIRMRRLHGAPPFYDFFTLVVSGAEEARVLRASAALRESMRGALDRNGVYEGQHITVLGPAPAPIAKINNRYRYHVCLVAKNNKTVRRFIEYYIKAFSADHENRALNVFVNCNAID